MEPLHRQGRMSRPSSFSASTPSKQILHCFWGSSCLSDMSSVERCELNVSEPADHHVADSCRRTPTRFLEASAQRGRVCSYSTDLFCYLADFFLPRMSQDDQGTSRSRLRLAGAVAGMGSGALYHTSSHLTCLMFVTGLTKVDIHACV